MESVNIFKGYGKVNAIDNHSDSSSNRQRRRCRIIAISLTVFLTIIIGVFLFGLIYESAAESEESELSELASISAESLKTVCAVTQYPDSCVSAISPLNSPPSTDPFRFFNLSLHAAMIEASTLKNLLSAPKSSDPAMKDCAELFDESASQLKRSAELICVGPWEKVLTEMKISDLKTWISAAMTDQQTCIDGLLEMGSTALGDFNVRVQHSMEYMSNTLAILNNIQSLCEKFGYDAVRMRKQWIFLLFFIGLFYAFLCVYFVMGKIYARE